MSEDFLNKFAGKSSDILGDAVKNSPYKTSKEPTRSVQVRLDAFKKLKIIAFNSDKKLVDVLDEMIQLGLNNDEFKKYLK